MSFNVILLYLSPSLFQEHVHYNMLLVKAKIEEMIVLLLFLLLLKFLGWRPLIGT